MQKATWSIQINAPAKKVWEIMFAPDTYRVWTKPFNSDSGFEGDWSEGSEIRFVGADPETGEMGGMFSVIRANRPYEFMSIEHLGIIVGGVVDTESEEVKKWTPAFENYTFKDNGGVTELLIEIDLADEHKEMFDTMWPEALQVLKTLAEQ